MCSRSGQGGDRENFTKQVDFSSNRGSLLAEKFHIGIQPYRMQPYKRRQNQKPVRNEKRRNILRD